jgi:hypothetical protein
MQISQITDIKQLEAMIAASISHIERMALGEENLDLDALSEMQLDLMRLEIRLEEIIERKAEKNLK